MYGSLPPVCVGDQKVGYHLEEGPHTTIYNWHIEGEETGKVDVMRFGDSVYIDWNVDEDGYYTIEVREINVFFNGAGDTIQKCQGAPYRDSVLIKGPTDVEIGPEQFVCKGEEANFETGKSYEEYMWMNGSSREQIDYKEEGTVWVEVTETYDSLACSYRDSSYLNVHELPDVELGADVSICGNEEYMLDAGNDGIMWEWYTGDNLNESYAYEQSITVDQNTLISQDIDTFRVKVEDENGCISEDTVVISPCDKKLGDIMTVMTPNGDGYNDRFRIKRIEQYPENYKNTVVEIYDRWGKLVFQSEPGYPEPWDGTDRRGKDLSMGSYFYVIDIQNQGEPITGHITIVR